MERVPQDHAVGPLLIVLVKLDLAVEFQLIEVIEEAGKEAAVLGLLWLLRLYSFDNDAGLDDFLNVDRHDVDFERFPVLFILALPDELRVERRVAGIEHLRRLRFILGHEVPQLLGRDVLAGVVMPVGVKLRERRRRVFLLACRWLFLLGCHQTASDAVANDASMGTYQSRVTPYASRGESALTIGICSTSTWATSNRSNGSLCPCGNGSPINRAVCVGRIGNT